jgi:hypothetical protein
MPETQDDEYSALAAAIGGQVNAQFFSDAETPPPVEPAPVVPDVPADATTPTDVVETPPAETAEQAAEPDPLKDAEPFTYKVDGEIRTIDGAQIVPGLGAIIPTEVLATVQDRLGQADRLHAINKTQYETIQRFEQAGGHEALQKLSVENAQSQAAAITMLTTLLENPDLLAQIALAETREQRQQILNNTVLREARNSAREARLNILDAPQQTPTIDLTVPETRDTVLTNSVAHVAKEAAADFPGLTAGRHRVRHQSRQAIQRLHPRPRRPRSRPARRRSKPGDTIVAVRHDRQDAERPRRVARVASLTRRESDDAAKQNTARLAAARTTENRSHARRQARGSGHTGRRDVGTDQRPMGRGRVRHAARITHLRPQ